MYLSATGELRPVKCRYCALPLWEGPREVHPRRCCYGQSMLSIDYIDHQYIMLLTIAGNSICSSIFHQSINIVNSQHVPTMMKSSCCKLSHVSDSREKRAWQWL
jgi:hypothetical protein